MNTSFKTRVVSGHGEKVNTGFQHMALFQCLSVLVSSTKYNSQLRLCREGNGIATVQKWVPDKIPDEPLTRLAQTAAALKIHDKKLVLTHSITDIKKRFKLIVQVRRSLKTWTILFPFYSLHASVTHVITAGE